MPVYFSAIICKADTFITSCLLFCTSILSLKKKREKRICLKMDSSNTLCGRVYTVFNGLK